MGTFIVVMAIFSPLLLQILIEIGKRMCPGYSTEERNHRNGR